MVRSGPLCVPISAALAVHGLTPIGLNSVTGTRLLQGHHGAGAALMNDSVTGAPMLT